MVVFNKKEYALDYSEDVLVIIENKSQDIFILNGSARYLFDNLLLQKSISSIVEEFVVNYQINLKDTSFETVFSDFTDIASELFEKGVLCNETTTT